MGRIAPSPIQQGQRSFNRLRLGLPASLILTHDRANCILENISLTGACIRLSQPVNKGSTAVLCFHQLRLFAVVMWKRGDLCGLRFEAPVEREDMKGFLWIVQNREEYHRICREELLEDTATGFGG